MQSAVENCSNKVVLSTFIIIIIYLCQVKLCYVKFSYQIKCNYPNIYIYKVVFTGGSNGAIFRYPLLIDFSSFGSKRDSGPHRRAVEERFITDAASCLASQRVFIDQNNP